MKEDKQAKHVMKSMMAKGMPHEKAMSVGYATVNKGKKKKKFNAKAFDKAKKSVFKT